jgi:hypothetical protein
MPTRRKSNATKAVSAYRCFRPQKRMCARSSPSLRLSRPLELTTVRTPHPFGDSEFSALKGIERLPSLFGYGCAGLGWNGLQNAPDIVVWGALAPSSPRWI